MHGHDGIVGFVTCNESIQPVALVLVDNSAVYTFPALKIFMGGIYVLNWAELNSMQFNAFWCQFDAIQKSSNRKIQHNSKMHWIALNCVEFNA